MKQHLEILNQVLTDGHIHEDRTTVGRQSVFGVQHRFKMEDGFPLSTTREINTNALVEELLWFIRGSVDVNELTDKGVHIWDRWVVSETHIREFIQKHDIVNMEGDQYSEDEIVNSFKLHYSGAIGPMYGAMWRNAPVSNVHRLSPLVAMEDIASDKLDAYKEAYLQFLKEKATTPIATQETPSISEEEFCSLSYESTKDQLNDLIIGLKRRPYSSRHVVSAWVPEYIPNETISPQENVLLGRGALAPCHNFFQCFVTPPANVDDKPKLSLLLYIRSNDLAVGFSYNVAQYALLLHMLAQVTGMEAYELIYTGGDVHIYSDQLELVKEQVSRTVHTLPTIWLNPEVTDIFKFTPEDIKVINYTSHPAIRYPVAV